MLKLLVFHTRVILFENRGFIRCTEFFVFTSYIHVLYFLTGIPVVQIPQPSYTVNLAQTITITCTVTANPTHTSVQWQRTQNGVTTNIGVGSGKYSGGTVNSPSLSINNADLNDIGQYVCSATNIVGTGTSTATTLNVVGGMIQKLKYITCIKLNRCFTLCSVKSRNSKNLSSAFLLFFIFLGMYGRGKC